MPRQAKVDENCYEQIKQKLINCNTNFSLQWQTCDQRESLRLLLAFLLSNKPTKKMLQRQLKTSELVKDS